MFSKIFSKGDKVDIPWNSLTTIDQLEEVDKNSQKKPVLLFKHSTRCSISAMSLARFERSYEETAAFEPYFLDLIAHRDVSNAIAEKYGVVHQSPQTILIKNGKAVFDSSHMGISYSELNNHAQKS
ncbi:bacillithiol system redox-active protein YtxJ [Ekhidna sp.]|uniref:bacillithiol system redox-active protein YtxJ n=1 Tax=Ekhidna sp. TaxID=2608089 RepID=UPI003B5C2C5E